MTFPQPEAPRPDRPVLPPSIVPVAHFAKWPPDDLDDAGPGGGTPATPGDGGGGGMGGGGGGYYDSGDGNFKKGATKPALIIVGILLAVGGAAAVGFAIKGESEKVSVADVNRERNQLLLQPTEQALPKWREWAAREEVPTMQQEAFAQLAWAKDPLAIDAIIAGLANKDHRVRGTAAQALIEYGAAAERAKPALLKALAESDDSDKPQICWALAVLKEPAAYDTIFAEYRAGHLAKVQRLDGSPTFDPETLANLASLDKLAELKADPSASVRQLVATALSKSAEPKWTDALITLVKDKDIEVAREAAVGLGKIANEAAMTPLLEALGKADKDHRESFLGAMRDGVGGRGLVVALRSIDKTHEKFQLKVIFDMLRELEDPRVGDALDEYLKTDPKPHWRTEAALRMAEVGDLRAVPHLAWRMQQDPLKLYNQIDDPEHRQDDNERVVSARMLADLAILHPDAKAKILQEAEGAVMEWVTSKPQPHANGLRFLAAAGSPQVLPKLKAWADPNKPLPGPGAQPPVAMEWETAQSALRYMGWAQQNFGILEKQMFRQGKEKYDLTMEGMMGGGVAVLGMTLRGLAFGAADGFAQWGDPKAYPTLVKYIEEKQNNEQSRIEACFAISWASTDENMKEVASKVQKFGGADPKDTFIRKCYLESLIHRSVPEATGTLVDLIKNDSDIDVPRQAARAVGIGGMSPATAQALMGKLADQSTKTNAVVALMLGADTDTVKRAIATYNEGGPETMEELKMVYNGSFGYWSDVNYSHGDVARWVANAEAISRVKVNDALQDWPKQLLSRAMQGDFDNGPRSMTRVQLRVKLYRDAKSGDPKKQAESLSILKFMKEKGVLMALRSEDGAWKEPARQAFFEVMNPKMFSDSLPDAPAAKK